MHTLSGFTINHGAYLFNSSKSIRMNLLFCITLFTPSYLSHSASFSSLLPAYSLTSCISLFSLFPSPFLSIIPQIWNPQNPITPPLKPTATASHTFINHHSMKLQIPQNISSELLITLENLQVPGICLQISIPLMTMVSFTVSNNSKIEISLVLWGEGKKSSILWFCGDEGWSPCEGIWKGLR